MSNVPPPGNSTSPASPTPSSNSTQSPPTSPPPTLSPPPPVAVEPPPPPSSIPPPSPSITPPPPANPQTPAPPQLPNSPPPIVEPPPPSVPQSSPPPSNPSPSPPFTPPPTSSSPSPPFSPPAPPDTISPSPPPPTSFSSPPVIVPTPPPPTILTPPSPPSNHSNGTSFPTGTVVAIVLVSIFLVGICGAIVLCVRHRRKKRPETHGDYIVPAVGSSSYGSGDHMLKMHEISSSNSGNGLANISNYSVYEPASFRTSRLWFTIGELMDATNGFSAHNLLGEGGFGPVYKGILVDGREVAVKRLKVGGGQGEREFRAEVEIISRVHHRHLVSLVGYCIFEETRLLVYDYLPNDTLYFHLHGEGIPVMDWATRVKIAVGAARGIAYLHEDCHPRIIHRDIKSSNILLDKNFEAQVSDFGLAKLAVDANTHITTRVMGTFGYMAPEYASSGKLTEKSDVYSFGVVLLELISGRKPVDTSQPIGEESLVEWARPRLNHALEREEFGGLPDPKLEGNYVAEEMFRIIEAAAACVRHSSAKRPAMGQVARALDSMSTSDLTNGMRVGESEILNPSLQSGIRRVFQNMVDGKSYYSSDSFSQISQNPW